MTWALGIGCVAVLSAGVGIVLGSRSHATAAVTVEEEQPTKPKAKPASKPTEDEAPKKPATPPKPAAEWVAKLVPLTSKPWSGKPKEVLRNYEKTGVDRYFYDFAPLGEIEVNVRASKSAAWQVITPIQASDPKEWSTSVGLTLLAKSKLATWWRIVDGPFSGQFLFQSLGTIEVRSKCDVCAGQVKDSQPGTGGVWDLLKAVENECAKEKDWCTPSQAAAPKVVAPPAPPVADDDPPTDVDPERKAVKVHTGKP